MNLVGGWKALLENLIFLLLIKVQTIIITMNVLLRIFAMKCGQDNLPINVHIYEY